MIGQEASRLHHSLRYLRDSFKVLFGLFVLEGFQVVFNALCGVVAEEFAHRFLVVGGRDFILQGSRSSEKEIKQVNFWLF